MFEFWFQNPKDHFSSTKVAEFDYEFDAQYFFKLTQPIKRYEEKGALKVTTTISHYRSRKNQSS